MDRFGGGVGRDWSLRTQRPECHHGNGSVKNSRQLDKAGVGRVKENSTLNFELFL